MTAEDALKEREERENVISAKCGNKTFMSVLSLHFVGMQHLTATQLLLHVSVDE